jgi:hypothetical protein
MGCMMIKRRIAIVGVIEKPNPRPVSEGCNH